MYYLASIDTPMNFIEILTSIWNWITGIPQHIAEFFSNLQTVFTTLGNMVSNNNSIIQNIKDNIITQSRDSTIGVGTGLIFTGIIYAVILGFVFIFIDYLRDLL